METSQSKLTEFHSEMDTTNEWMDDTEKLLKSFNVGMDPEEATKLQEKTEVSYCVQYWLFATRLCWGTEQWNFPRLEIKYYFYANDFFYTTNVAAL